MVKIPFPSAAANKDFQKSINNLVRDVHKENVYKTLNPRNVQKFSHGRGWRTHSGDESARELSEMEQHSSEFALKFSDVIEQNISIIPNLILELTKAMHDQLMKSMYSKINDSTEKSGNVVSTSKAGSNAKAVLEMLKLIEFGVDEDGNVSLPQIHVATGSTILEDLQNENKEFHVEIEKVIQEKTSVALQKEQERLSKFHSHD